jgi:hypothetical protein
MTVTPHRLRHTYATALANADMSLQVLMALLGHVTPAMTIRYAARLHDSARRPTTTRWARCDATSRSPPPAGRSCRTRSAGSPRRCSRPASHTATAPGRKPRHDLTTGQCSRESPRAAGPSLANPLTGPLRYSQCFVRAAPPGAVRIERKHQRAASPVLPEGTVLSRHGVDELEAVANALNSRPRKTLGWRTPAEALNEHLLLAQQGSVATTG